MRELNVNYFSQCVSINDAFIFRTKLGFIRDTEVLPSLVLDMPYLLRPLPCFVALCLFLRWGNRNKGGVELMEQQNEEKRRDLLCGL